MSYVAMGTVTAAAAGGVIGPVAATTAGGLAPPPPVVSPPPGAAPPVATPVSSPMMTYLVIGGIGLAAYLVIKHIRKGKHDHTTARATHPASSTPVASEG